MSEKATPQPKLLSGGNRQIAKADGDSHWIRLGALVAATGDPWRHHRQADVAVMQIDATNIPEKHLRSLNALAFPAEDSLRLDPPGRTSAIEITGFPMLLGVTPAVSPLVMLGHVASRPSQLEASWGQEEILFTYPVVGAGCSGGPVFLSQQDPAEATVVGMCIGFYQDKFGFKLTKVVPAHLLLAFLRQQDSDDRQRDTGG